MKKKLLPAVLSILIFSIFTSCIGLSMDIQMRKDGSALLSMEYRVSAIAESLGRLDGNERWPITAAGQADWERTVQRTEGMKLVSFSSRERADETVTSVTLEFEDANALVKFLDPFGTKVSYFDGKFDIIIIEPAAAEINQDLLELFKTVSSQYKFAISFSADTNSALSITDGNKRVISPPSGAQIVPSGKKVSMSIDTADLFTLTDGLGISVTW